MENIINYYKVEKFDAKNHRWLDYGTLPEEDTKAVIRGYKRDAKLTEMFYKAYLDDNKDCPDMTGLYTRKGTENFFDIEFDFAIEQ